MRKFKNNKFPAKYKRGYEIVSYNLNTLITIVSRIIERDENFNIIVKKYRFTNVSIDTLESVLAYIQRKEKLSEEKSDYIKVLGNLYIFKNICNCILAHKYIPEDVLEVYNLKPNVILPIFSALSGEPTLKLLYKEDEGKL